VLRIARWRRPQRPPSRSTTTSIGPGRHRRASLGEERKAHYACVMALVRNADDAAPLVAEGIWRGEIARVPRGSSGFGYDPLFLLPGRGLTAAELPAEEKNRISHRGLAAARLLELLR